MNAKITADVHRTTSAPTFWVRELTVYLRTTVAALLAVAAVFVAARRLLGALETPLEPFQLLLAAACLAGLAQIAHFPSPAVRLHARDILVTLAALTIAASLSLSGSNFVALLGFWAGIVGEECWVWRGMLPAIRYAKADLQVSPPRAAESVENDVIVDPELTEPAADVLQQLTLRTRAEGGQELSGWLRLRLAAGQRTGNLHVAFCPSFDQVPQVQAEAVSGPDCRIKAAQVLPYGARLDVKLDEPADEQQSVLVWFFACSDVV